MIQILIKHAVSDFDEWKTAFDDHASTRMEYGSEGYRLFRLSEDADEVVALFEWDSMDSAREFLEESDLQDVMASAGVVGEPEIYFLDEVEAKTPETPIA